MSEAKDIHGHFDGTYIVPDEPVNLPINKPLVFRLQPETNEESVVRVRDMAPGQRRAELRKLLAMMKNNRDIPVEATRRVNLYADHRY